MQLDELQRLMASALFTPLQTDLQRTTASFIKDTPVLSAHERLEIYRESYWQRLSDAFYDDFPGLLAILGEKDFDQLTRAYLADKPSRSFTLRDLGQFLESWLTANPARLGDKYRIAVDMVKLEWAHIEAFDSAEHPALTLDELATAGANSRFSLQPHVKLLTLHYPVDDIRIDAESAPSALQYEGSTIFLSVFRENLSVRYMRLTESEFDLLTNLQAGATLEEAIEKTFLSSEKTLEEQSKILKEGFSLWARLGWLTGMTNVGKVKNS